MAPLNPPQYVQAGTYSARSDRLLMASEMTPRHGTGPLAMRSGVRPTPGNAGLAVTQRTTPSMFVTVAAGVAFIQSSVASGGGYMVANDAPQDVAIAASHATLGRRDLVVARIYDAEIAGAVSQWTLEVVTGTPAASPVTPTLPSGAFSLATVLIPAASTTVVDANITDNRVYTVSLGGTTPAPFNQFPSTPYRGMAAYDTTNFVPTWYSGTAWQTWTDWQRGTSATRPALPVEGQPFYETDTFRLMFFQGGAWSPQASGTQPIAILRGNATVTLTASTKIAIPFQAEDLDNYSGHSTVSNTTRYVCQISGWYRVSSTVGIVGAGTAELTLRLNGTTEMSGFSATSAAGGADRRYNGTWMLFLVPGNYIETVVYSFENTTSIVSNSATMMYVEWMTNGF